MSFKDNIALLLTPNGFWDERPAMTTFMENEVQEGINTAFNLINAECGNLPYKVLEYNAPHLANPDTMVDVNNDLYRNDYELEQFKQAIITQTQYTLNMGNDFSQGSSTLSTGGMSATVQRPEKRDIIAPGVLKFLQNARLYQLQVYTSATQKCTKNACDELGRLLTIDTGDVRYVKKYQDNATPGQVAFIDSNKQVSFANPSELSFNVLRAQEVLDRDGAYRQIKDVQNLAFFGNQGTDAMTRTQIDFDIKANKQYDENYNYMNEDIIWTWNESSRFIDYWKSKQDNNKGHPPQLDNSTWWERIFNRDVRAKYILDPIDNVYKTINQFDVHYFGGLSRDEIYSAINASGTSWNPDTTYAKGFVVIFVDSTNALEWYESLQDNNKGHNPESDTEWWKKLPTPAIDVNDVINQIKPYIEQIVSEDVAGEIDKLKTSITTDFAGSEYYFADEQAFEQFLQNNPKLQRDWFDDIPSVDLTGYAKLDGNNNFKGSNVFDGVSTFVGLTQVSQLRANSDASFQSVNATWLDIPQGFVRQQPTNGDNIANKQYVDDSISQIDTSNFAKLNQNNAYTGQNTFSNYVGFTGQVDVRGTQVLYQSPRIMYSTFNNDSPVSKQYVDSKSIKKINVQLNNSYITWRQTKKLWSTYGYSWGCEVVVSRLPSGFDITKIVNITYTNTRNFGSDMWFTMFNFSWWIYRGVSTPTILLSGFSPGSGADDYGLFFGSDNGYITIYYVE